MPAGGRRDGCLQPLPQDAWRRHGRWAPFAGLPGRDVGAEGSCSPYGAGLWIPFRLCLAPLGSPSCSKGPTSVTIVRRQGQQEGQAGVG